MNWLRLLFLMIVARPLARIFTGADLIDGARLPLNGPAIIAANHASHVDTLLLLTMFPARTLVKVRPVAAADYFLSGPVISWFSRRIIGIVPIARDRASSGDDVLAPAREALERGEIIIIFPEGSRQSGDALTRLKTGVAKLAAAFPGAPVTPVWLQGAGRVLPKGSVVPVPMNCTILVGEPIEWAGDRMRFMDELKTALQTLSDGAPPQRWS